MDATRIIVNEKIFSEANRWALNKLAITTSSGNYGWSA